MATLSFYGAAGTVTGSCSMLEVGDTRFLVDCGMFQGNKTIRELNAKDFPFDAASAEFLILTHAHIDHSGLLPKLVKHGFDGPIYCTPPTADLLSFMLLDSAKIQKSNTERQNRKRVRKGEDPVDPIYTEGDARKALDLLRGQGYDSWFEPHPGISVRYWNAGHMLGSASAEVKFADDGNGNTMRLLFSGDLGPEEKVFHPEPTAETGFDYIVCESTYGDRDRDDYTLEKRREMLRKELDITMALAGETNIANVGHHNLLVPPATARKVQQAKAESAATTTKKPAGAKPKTATKPKSAAKPRAAAAKSASAPKRQTPANRPAATRSKSAAKS